MQDITIGISSGGAGGVVGVLITLGFIWAKAKLNGKPPSTQVPSANACPTTAAKLEVLAADHVRQDNILDKLADSRVETGGALKTLIKATETQTELLRDRLPPR